MVLSRMIPVPSMFILDWSVDVSAVNVGEQPWGLLLLLLCLLVWLLLCLLLLLWVRRPSGESERGGSAPIRGVGTLRYLLILGENPACTNRVFTEGATNSSHFAILCFTRWAACRRCSETLPLHCSTGCGICHWRIDRCVARALARARRSSEVELWYSYPCPCLQKFYKLPTVPIRSTHLFYKLYWA